MSEILHNVMHSVILHKTKKSKKNYYVLDNNESYKYCEFQKNDIVENAPLIEEI